MNKKLIAVVVVVVALAVLGWRFWSGNGEENVLRFSGNIELTEVAMSFKTPGRLVELALDEGEEVRAGALVARLDQNELERGLEREEAGVRLAEAMLVQVRTGVEFQKAALEGELALRRAELEAAGLRLREMEAGSRPQEIAQARAAEAEARTQHRQARADWERAQQLFSNDDISAQQRDQFRARFEATRAALERASQAAALVREGPRREQIAQQRAAVERARAALRLAEAGQIDLRRREEEVAARAAEVKRASAQQGVLASQLGDRTLASPVDGVVLEKSAELGEVLAAGAAVLTIGDLDRPWVRGYIGERDLGRVKLGMPVAVRSDSYPGKQYKGRVTFISDEAEFTPKQIQTQEERVKLVYRIKVEVENPGRELKSNMPVDAEIRLQ